MKRQEIIEKYDGIEWELGHAVRLWFEDFAPL